MTWRRLSSRCAVNNCALKKDLHADEVTGSDSPGRTSIAIALLFVIPQGSAFAVAFVFAVVFAVACPFVCHPVGICVCRCGAHETLATFQTNHTFQVSQGFSLGISRRNKNGR
jgi:hypothetical protein